MSTMLLWGLYLFVVKFYSSGKRRYPGKKLKLAGLFYVAAGDLDGF